MGSVQSQIKVKHTKMERDSTTTSASVSECQQEQSSFEGFGGYQILINFKI